MARATFVGLFAFALLGVSYILHGADGWPARVIVAAAMAAISTGAARWSAAFCPNSWRFVRVAFASAMSFAGLFVLTLISASVGLLDTQVECLLFIVFSMAYALLAASFLVLGHSAPTPATRHRRLLAVASALITLPLCVLGFITVFGPAQFKYAIAIREGNRLAARIESFRHEQGRLPESFDELGVSPRDPDWLFYRKCNEHRYLLSFSWNLDESMTYDSATRKWKESNEVCQEDLDERGLK